VGFRDKKTDNVKGSAADDNVEVERTHSLAEEAIEADQSMLHLQLLVSKSFAKNRVPPL